MSGNLKQEFDLGIVMEHNQLNAYRYMCERNALNVALWGYGVEEPLLLTRPGLYIRDINFLGTGRFSTSFSRNMLDDKVSPILSNTKYKLDWDIIDIHLLKNQLVFVNVDVFFMPYKVNTYYKKSHGSHVIILLRKTSNGYIVLDWYDPDYYIGEVSLEQLTQARVSANQKSYIGSFSGFGIKSAYRLLNIDLLPKQLEINKMIYRNMYNSMKYMLTDRGGVALFKNLSNFQPKWLQELDVSTYENAIESFFFLDLELEYLCFYYSAMMKSGDYINFYPAELQKKAIMLQQIVKSIKNMLLIAYRRSSPIQSDVWADSFEQLYLNLFDYCEYSLHVLKSITNSDKR